MDTSRRDLIKGAGAAALAAGASAWLQPAAAQQRLTVIDVHGHYTTAPQALRDFRQQQLAGQAPSKAMLNFSDDQMRESVQPQLKFQRERGTDVTLFSPQAAGM